MFSGDEVSSLVFDLGSFNFRIGFSGEDSPKHVFQPVIGVNQQSNYFFETNLRYFKEGTKVLNFMSSNGAIENYDLFEKVVDYIYGENLSVDPNDHPILFSEPSLHNKEHRIKLTEFMFEKYRIPALFICKSAVLSSFSCGRSTCLVFDSGNSMTYAVAVHDGYALQKSLLKNDVGGHYITTELMKRIEEKKGKIVPHYKFTKTKVEDHFETEYITGIRDDPSYENFWKGEIIRDLKENYLMTNEEPILYDGKQSMTSVPIASYELPDGKIIELGEDRISITEKLFNPIKEFPGFQGYHQMINDVINSSDLEIKKELNANIFVCGGNTLFANFPERLQKQLSNHMSQNLRLKIITHPTSTERKFASWIGGSILSSLGTFHQLWLSRLEFEEHGAMIIERKCA